MFEGTVVHLGIKDALEAAASAIVRTHIPYRYSSPSMSSPTGQQLRFDPKTRTHYALDARTGRWVPVGPPNPSNQPRTTPLPSGSRLPATQTDVAPRSPPSASSSSYTTAAPDATGTAAQLQGLSIGSRAGGSNQCVTAAGTPLQTRPTLDPGIALSDYHAYTDTKLLRLSGSRPAKAVLQIR